MSFGGEVGAGGRARGDGGVERAGDPRHVDEGEPRLESLGVAGGTSHGDLERRDRILEGVEAGGAVARAEREVDGAFAITDGIDVHRDLGVRLRTLVDEHFGHTRAAGGCAAGWPGE